MFNFTQRLVNFWGNYKIRVNVWCYIVNLCYKNGDMFYGILPIRYRGFSFYKSKLLAFKFIDKEILTFKIWNH